MSNPCKSERIISYDITNIPTYNIDGTCAQNLQHNAGMIRQNLDIGKVSSGITRFDEAKLSESFKNQIRNWRERKTDRKEFAGYLTRNLDLIGDEIESEEDSGVSKEEIKKLSERDDIKMLNTDDLILFHTHPIYKDLKTVGPPSDNDIEMIYLDAIRTGKNKINMVFAEEGVYVYCLYPEAFARILQTAKNNKYLESIINFNLSDHIHTIFKNIGMKDKIEYVLPNISKEEYMQILKTIGIYIDLFDYDSIIRIPIFDTVDELPPINDYEIATYVNPNEKIVSVREQGMQSRNLFGEEQEQDSEMRPRNLFGQEQEQESELQPRNLFGQEQESELQPRNLFGQQQIKESPPKKLRTERRLNFAGDYKAKYLKYKMKYLELKKQKVNN